MTSTDKAPLDRTFRARTMIELKQAIYDAHGWKRKAGESVGGRLKPLYDFRADHQANLIIATPRADRQPVADLIDLVRGKRGQR